MAYLYRVGAVLLLALTLAMTWTPVRAATGWRAGGGPCLATVAAAGDSTIPARNATSGGVTYVVWRTFANETTGEYGGSYTSQVGSGPVSVVQPWSASATVCTFQTQAEKDAECKGVADALNYIKAPLVHYGSVGLTACYGGYVIAGSGGAAGGGQSELYGPFQCSGSAGSACTAIPKPSSIVVTCKAGEYPGTVNGVQVCVPPSSSVDAPKTTTATPPAPGGTAPPIPNAPAGTASQSEQTTCTGTSCSTTTTYKDSGGNPLGSKTEESSKADYCADNPRAPGCTEEKSSFSGSCAGGFVGEGDALQVAIAREQHTRNCQFYENPTEQAKFNTEAAKTGKQYTEDTVAISSASFSQTNLLGVGAQCITDKTITVMTSTVVLPFSRVCPSLDQLGTILLGVAFITALMIVAKGKD